MLKKTKLMMAAATMSIASFGSAFAMDSVAEVTVSAKGEAIESSNALNFWPNLETDLQKKIFDALWEDGAEYHYDVTVDIQEIGLDASKMLDEDGKFNHLMGWVRVQDELTGESIENFQIDLKAHLETMGEAPEGVILILPDDEDFYTAMLDAFVEKTEEHVMTVDFEAYEAAQEASN